ncbi:MAG: universal stress protein [Hyphomicrobiales bacterium]|nr:universal stress protein [Hyphomicrobiales bacterium]
MRNLLVHLDSSPQSAARLTLAANLARRLDARLVGVFAQVAAVHAGVIAAWPPADYVAAFKQAKAAFEAATAGVKSSECIDLNRGAEAEILAQSVDLARHFDLVVCGQPTADNALAPVDLVERIVVDSGRPALVIPYAGRFEDVGKRPLFAWSNSPEAARALADGAHLVQKGAEAAVVSVSKPDAPDVAYNRTSLDLAVAHLAAYGIAAKPDQAVAVDIGLMDALLNQAADHSADLLVIGAFGGQGYPRFSRGSGSRFMLKHMTLPVLFSH